MDKRGLREIKSFFKIPLVTFLSPIHVLHKCQISENYDVRILRYRVTGTDEQMNERTDLIPQVSFRLNAERPKNSLFELSLVQQPTIIRELYRDLHVLNYRGYFQAC